MNQTTTLNMELEIYSQVAILLTTLFSGSDTRPAASRQTSIIRLQSVVSIVNIEVKQGHSTNVAVVKYE